MKIKKILCVFICLFILYSSPIYTSQKYCYANSKTSDLEVELEENIENQIHSLDFDSVDKILFSMSESDLFFKNDSFSSKLKQLIGGEVATDSKSLFSYVINITLDDILEYLPSVCLIIAISVLYSMLINVCVNKNKISDVVHFVCYGSIVFIMCLGLKNIISLTTSAVGGIKTQMDAVFPLLLTLLTALGSNVSVSVYQPAMAVLSGLVINIFTNILLPIFAFKIVFNVISNLTSGIKFSKFSDFFGSCYKWIIGIVLTIFSAFISIQGIMAGSVDGISIRTAKFTIKSGVPIIGGFLSDSVGLIMVSSSLIKNAVGVGGLLILFGTIILPVIKIVVFSLLMKLTSAILEPIADSRITNFVCNMSKSISLIISAILGVAFMYFILVGLVMCSANIF